MAAGRLNFDGRQSDWVEQGSTFVRTLVYKDSNGNPVNLTGYAARMQIRRSYGSDTVVMELTSANGRITITPAQGKLDLFISAQDTATLDADDEKSVSPPRTTYVYDLELVNGPEVVRLLYGNFVVTQEVTR